MGDFSSQVSRRGRSDEIVLSSRSAQLMQYSRIYQFNSDTQHVSNDMKLLRKILTIHEFLNVHLFLRTHNKQLPPVFSSLYQFVPHRVYLNIYINSHKFHVTGWNVISTNRLPLVKSTTLPLDRWSPRIQSCWGTSQKPSLTKEVYFSPR